MKKNPRITVKKALKKHNLKQKLTTVLISEPLGELVVLSRHYFTDFLLVDHLFLLQFQIKVSLRKQKAFVTMFT